MNKITFLPEAWEDFSYWQEQDKKALRRILLILQDISRNAYEGIGKPERLRENLSGWWSRRIDDTNRIVYRVQKDGSIEIAQCKGHYYSH